MRLNPNDGMQSAVQVVLRCLDGLTGTSFNFSGWVSIELNLYYHVFIVSASARPVCS